MKNKFSLQKTSILTSMTVAALAFSACTKKENTNDFQQKIQPKPEVRAESQTNQSIQWIKGGKFRIQKNALNKEFLLAGALIPQAPTPEFSSMKSRIVAFKQSDDQLIMLEATQGHVVKSDYPVNLILTQFPILSETDDEIVFDFNKGMKKLFGEGDWGGNGKPDEYVLNPVAVSNSFIDSAEFQGNTLVIRQVAQIPNPGNEITETPGSKEQLIPVEVKYFLSAYQPNKNFKPFPSVGLEKVGFFEVSPWMKEDRTPQVFAARFDLNKTITFALSANTPEEVKEALKDSVMYWNRAIGKDNVKVIELTDASITAPNANYNMIQWLDDDNAGYAYADDQLDPRSGEILHAQIYLPSVFYGGSRPNLVKLIKYLQTKDHNGSNKKIQLKGFEARSLCQRSFLEAGGDKVLKLALDPKVSDDTLKKALLDVLREATTHELGHIFGLRHNFAGSLASEIPRANLSEEFRNYIEAGAVNVKKLITTSSIMDYEFFEDSVLAGDLIHQGKVLEYDQKAFDILYLGADLNQKLPLFCTDESIRKNVDCQQFDAGSSFVEHIVHTMKDRVQRFPENFIMNYNLQKTKVPTITRQSWDATASAKIFVKDSVQLFLAFTDQGQQVAVRKSADVTNLPAYLMSAESEKLTQLVQASGGTEHVMSTVMASIFGVEGKSLEDFWLARLELSMTNPMYKLNDLEKVQIRDFAKIYFPELAKSIRVETLKLWTMAGLGDAAGTIFYRNTDIVNKDLAQVFVEAGTNVLTFKNGKTIETSYVVAGKTPAETKEYKVSLPIYAYSLQERALAASFFAPGTSKSTIWGLMEKVQIGMPLMHDLTFEFGLMNDPRASGLSSEGRTWLFENLKLISLFGGN